MTFINERVLPDISVREKFAISITFTNLPTSGNEIVSLTRYKNRMASNGTDIAANAVAMATNELAFSNIWLPGDTPLSGKYRICAVAHEVSNNTIEECNLIVTVLP
jgi:hypothetical protein